MTETTDAKPIRILIADDHPLVRRGLRSLFALEPGMDTQLPLSLTSECILVILISNLIHPLQGRGRGQRRLCKCHLLHGSPRRRRNGWLKEGNSPRTKGFHTLLSLLEEQQKVIKIEFK